MKHKRKTWRQEIAPIIAKAIAEARAHGLTGRDFRRYLRESRPWTFATTSWGRKVWNSELAYQLGKKRRPVPACGRPRVADAPGQGVLFDAPPSPSEVVSRGRSKSSRKAPRRPAGASAAVASTDGPQEPPRP